MNQQKKEHMTPSVVVTPRRASSPAFTLIELLVVIAIIAILAAMLLPALTIAKQQAQGAHDLSNMKQTQLAWHLYTSDASDYLPGNDYVAEANWTYLNTPGAGPALNWVSGWESAGDPSADASGGGDETNTDLLINSKYATIGAYVTNPKLYQCSASRILCQEPNGVVAPLARDISMNVWMGASTPAPAGYQGKGNYNQAPSDDTNDGWIIFQKMSDITGFSVNAGINFSPSMALVFIEEKDDSIDDGEFLVQYKDSVTGTGAPEIANVPACYHGGNQGLVSFADGHAEIHTWRSQTVTGAPFDAGIVHWGSGVARPDNFKSMCNGDTINSFALDIGWLQKHASYSAIRSPYQYISKFNIPN